MSINLEQAWATFLQVFNQNTPIPGTSYANQPKTPLDRKKWLSERLIASLNQLYTEINSPNFNIRNTTFPTQTVLIKALNAVTLEDGNAIIDKLFSIKINLEERIANRVGYQALDLFSYFIDEDNIPELFNQLPFELSIKIISHWSSQPVFEKLPDRVKDQIYTILLDKIDINVVAKLPETLASVPFDLAIEFIRSDHFKPIYQSMTEESKAKIFNTLLNKASGVFEKNQVNDTFLALKSQGATPSAKI